MKKTLIIFFLLLMQSFVKADGTTFVIPYSIADCNVYGTITTSDGLEIWNNETNAFETYSDANMAAYAISASWSGGGKYPCDFNSAISAGNYICDGYLQAGAEPNAANDTWIAGPTVVSWDGSAFITNYTIHTAADTNFTIIKASIDTVPTAEENRQEMDNNSVDLNQLRIDANDLKAIRSVPGGG